MPYNADTIDSFIEKFTYEENLFLKQIIERKLDPNYSVKLILEQPLY